MSLAELFRAGRRPSRRLVCVALLALAACAEPPEAPPPRRIRDLPCAGVEPTTSAAPAEPPPAVHERPLAPEPVLPQSCARRSDLPLRGSVAIASGTWYGGEPGDAVLRAPRVLLVLSYPLSRDALFSVEARSPGGFGLRELADAVRAAYAQIYAIEDGTPAPAIPTRGPHLINRGPRFGVWGHDIGDLFLESLTLCETEDGTLVVEAGVGS